LGSPRAAFAPLLLPTFMSAHLRDRHLLTYFFSSSSPPPLLFFGLVKSCFSVFFCSTCGRLLPGYALPWEDSSAPYPAHLAHPRTVAVHASSGASDYGNKYGEPVVCGFCRSFGLRVPAVPAAADKAAGAAGAAAGAAATERVEWIKPIMFTAGVSGPLTQDRGGHRSSICFLNAPLPFLLSLPNLPFLLGQMDANNPILPFFAGGPNGHQRHLTQPSPYSQVGQMDARHATKGRPQPGMLVVKVGGPAYRIGLGGGAASSRVNDAASAALDFNAVQV
jgi:hypothetical protein